MYWYLFTDWLCLWHKKRQYAWAPSEDRTHLSLQEQFVNFYISTAVLISSKNRFKNCTSKISVIMLPYIYLFNFTNKSCCNTTIIFSCSVKKGMSRTTTTLLLCWCFLRNRCCCSFCKKKYLFINYLISVISGRREGLRNSHICHSTHKICQNGPNITIIKKNIPTLASLVEWSSLNLNCQYQWVI